MLVLSRKLGEEIVIDQSIRITVTEIGSGRVKIGVTAPREMAVLRAELMPHDADTDWHELLTARPQWGRTLAGRDVRTAPLPR